MSNTVACWNCETSLSPSVLFCSECGKIQQPFSKNIFELFGLERNFSPDLTQLEKAYFKIQSQIHPDHYVTASQKEKLYASQHAMNINSAYQALKDPLKRAEQLLEINGLPQKDKNAQDTDLLLEIMNLKEQMEEDEPKVLKAIDKKINHSWEELTKAFLDRDFSLAEKNLNRLKYLKRLQGKD